MTSTSVGYVSGFNLGIFVPDDDFVTYSMSDHRNRLVYREMNRMLDSGKTTNLIIEQQIEKKLPEPYNDCKQNLDTIDAYDSELYRETFKASVPYRQVNCFNLCSVKYIAKQCNCTESYSDCSSNSIFFYVTYFTFF